MTDVFATASALVAAFVRGEASPVDHVEAQLERIARLEPKLQSFIRVYPDEAREAAAAAAAQIRRGEAPGPLAGVAFALKDLVDLAGRETIGGAPALAGRVPTESAVIAKRLFAAGGVLVGKTHTVEIAMGGWGTNQNLGTPWNPWDLDVPHTPGGSSSGSGVAVAAGLVPFAIGTDTGGSVRLPAAFCGIVGLKVTEHVIPLTGIIPLAHSIDTPGPMARSVPDCALGYEVLRGVEPHAVLADLLAGRGLFAEIARGIEGMAVGTLDDVEREGVDPPVLAAYDAALETLERLGARLRPVSLPRHTEWFNERNGLISAAEGYYHHGARYEDPATVVDHDVRARVLRGRDIPARDYVAVMAERPAEQAAFLDAIAGVDLLAWPTVSALPQPLDTVDQASTPARFTRPANYLGLCGLALPIGVADGLPTGFQLMGRPHAEALVLRAGAAFERAVPMPHPSI